MPSKETLMVQQAASRTVAEAILEQLNLYGVKRIYGVIGDAIFGLMDAIAKQTRIQFIAVKHESIAAMMASAEAKCTGKLGVCIAQMGPGLANLINGLGDAYLDGSPVLAITGQAPLKKIGTAYKQFTNQQELVQAVTAYSQLIVHPDAVIDTLTRAIHTSLYINTVSHLSIPTDLFRMPTLIPTNEATAFSDKKLNTGQLEKALRIISSAKKPMLLVGNKVRPFKAEIQQLAELWGGGIAGGYGAIGIFPDSFPSGLGGLGEGGNPFLTDLFKQSDVVLAVETNWWPGGHIPANASVIQIQSKEIHLGKGMPLDCGIIGNPAEIISELINRLKTHNTNQNWLDQIHSCKEIWSTKNEKEGNKKSFPLEPSQIIRAIESSIAGDTIITLDEGDSTLWFMRNFRGQCEQVLLSENWRTMGFGLPSAMAAKLSMPEKQVICITGDGGIEMVLADLLTAARYQLKILVIVFNNGMLQMEYNKMLQKDFTPKGVQLTNPDFVKLAEACGWETHRIQSENELEQLIKTSLQSEKPVLLDVPTAGIPYPDYQNT